MSESCNSRHFSWLMKSCFPNPQQTHHPSPAIPTTKAAAAATTTISSLPDDLLLECLARVPHSSLPALPFVCRRWSHLVDSPSFHRLRHHHHLLSLTLFSISIQNSTLFAASHHLDHDQSWKISCFLPPDDAVLQNGYFYSLFSHLRLAAIGRKVYILGRTAMLSCDTWTGTVMPRPGTLVARKKFAAATIDGKIYVAGGCVRTAAVEEYDPAAVEEYDPEENSWQVVAHAPRRRYGCVGASVDGVFYIIGGLKIGGPARNDGPSAAVHIYASSMDLYDVAAREWLRSRAVPGGGCVVAACAAGGDIYVLSSHAVELSFWKFNALRKCSHFGEWFRIKPPPLSAQVRLDGTVRFCCVGVGEKVVLIQVMGCIDDLLRRSGRSARGLKEGLVLVYDCAAGEWSRGADLPEAIRRAACVCVEC